MQHRFVRNVLPSPSFTKVSLATHTQGGAQHTQLLSFECMKTCVICLRKKNNNIVLARLGLTERILVYRCWRHDGTRGGRAVGLVVLRGDVVQPRITPKITTRGPLQEERLKREAERLAADQARREAAEVRRREEAARRAEEDRLAREEEAR